MTSFISSFYKGANVLHDAYVKGFEYLEDGTSFVARKLHRPLHATQGALGKIASYPLGILARGAARTLAKSVSLKNRLLGSKKPEENDRTLKSLRPEIAALRRDIKKSLRILSLACLKLFNRPLFFKEIPNQADLFLLRERLLIMKGDHSLSPTQEIELRKALTECRKIFEYPEKLRTLLSHQITEQDFAELHQRILDSNLVYQLSEEATLENVAETLGGMAVERDLLLSDEYNPAAIAFSATKEKVGIPLGRLAGLSASITASYYLLEKLLRSASKNTRRIAQVSCALALLLFEYHNLNPLSNFTKEFAGNQLGNFSFYTVSTLASYIGMRVFGTSERLPNYVRKMTAATLVYNGATCLFSQLGMSSYINLPISFYLMHVAYNSDIYKDFVRGGQLAGRVTNPLIRETVTSGELLVGRALLTKVALGALSETAVYSLDMLPAEGVSELMAKSLNFRSPELLSLIAFGSAERSIRPFYSPLLGGQDLDDGRQVVRAFVANHLPEMRALSHEQIGQLETGWVSTRREQPYCVASFLAREIDDLISHCEKRGVKESIAAFLTQTLTHLKNTSVSNMQLQNGIEWRALQTRLITALDDEEERAGALLLLSKQVEPQIEDAINTTSVEAEALIEAQLDKLSPLILKVSQEEEFCSLLFINAFAEALISRVTRRVQSMDGALVDRLQPLTDREVVSFFKKASHFILQQRYSIDRGVVKSAYRLGANALIQHQI